MKMPNVVVDIPSMSAKDGVIQELLAMKAKTRLRYIEDAIVTAALSAAFCTLHEAASELRECPILNFEQFFHEFRIASWCLEEEDVIWRFFEYFRHLVIELFLGDNF